MANVNNVENFDSDDSIFGSDDESNEIFDGFFSQSEGGDKYSSDSDDEYLFTSDETNFINDNWEKVNNIADDTTDTSFSFLPTTIGSKNIPSNCFNPVDFILLLFGINFINDIVQATNNYGDAKSSEKSTGKPHSRFHRWYHTTTEEMKAFFGIILNMGLIHKSCINEYWNTDETQATPYFSTIFSRDRFLMLLSMFHVPEVNLDLPGRMHKVIGFIRHFNDQFQKYYCPNQQLAIDESLIGFQGRAPSIQYMPNKHHHRFGIKLWNMCESTTGYTLASQPFPGKSAANDTANHGLTFNVCSTLIKPYLRKGYHLFVDNFFTSIPLAEYLYREKTYLTGTVRKSRKGIPDLLKVRQQKGNVTAARKGPILLANYEDRKPVFILSTKETVAPVQFVSNRGRIHKDVPQVIVEYNKYMGGVDLADMRTYMFLDERRTLKWTKKVFFFMFGRLALNAYILYKHAAQTCNAYRIYQAISNTPGARGAIKILDRRQFVVLCVKGLVGSFRVERKAPGRKIAILEDRLTNTKDHLNAEKLPVGKRRNCAVCSNSKAGKRVRTSFECKTCDVGLCPGECWEAYHTKKVLQ